MFKPQGKFPLWQWLGVTLAGSTLMFADGRFNHSRARQFVDAHFWLVIFLPLTLLALFLFVRGFYLEYRQ
jgi:hypothetical protein